jgi:hypothetical protein
MLKSGVFWDVTLCGSCKNRRFGGNQPPLSIMYDILSLTNSTLLTADMILLCTKKNLYPIHGSHSPFHRKMCIPLLVWCHFPPIWPPALPLNLTYIWIVPSKLSLGSPPYTNSLCSMLNLMSIFLRLVRLSKESIQVRGSVWLFVTSLFFYGDGLLAPRPTSQLADHPLLFVRGCLFNIFTAISNHNLTTCV